MNETDPVDKWEMVKRDCADPSGKETSGKVDGESSNPAKGYTVRSWGEVVELNIPPKQSIVGGFFTCSQVQVIFGQGGVGKSRLGLNIARNQVLGLPFLGMETGAKPLRHLFIGNENDIHRWQIDCRCMSRGLKQEQIEKLKEHIFMTTLENPDDFLIGLDDAENRRKWQETVDKWVPDVIWIDPWGSVVAGEGSDREVRDTLAFLRNLAPDAGIVIIAHARTGVANILQAAGYDSANFGKDSKALYSVARAVVNIAPFDDSEHPDLCWIPAKNNNGCKPESLRISLNPATMTYEAIEKLDEKEWMQRVAATSKQAQKSRSVPCDPDAVLALVEKEPLSKSVLTQKINEQGVAIRKAQAVIEELLGTEKLKEWAGKGNTKLIGTPECFLNKTNITSGLSDSPPMPLRQT